MYLLLHTSLQRKGCDPCATHLNEKSKHYYTFSGTDFVMWNEECCCCECDWERREEEEGCGLEPRVTAPRLCWLLQTEQRHPRRGGGRGSAWSLVSGGRGTEEGGKGGGGG